jgi:hypothetical protein
MVTILRELSFSQCFARVPFLAVRARMFRRLYVSVLVALVLAASFQVSVAASRPRYLICELEDGGQLFLIIESFGGMGGAVSHCVHFWGGHPVGVE